MTTSEIEQSAVGAEDAPRADVPASPNVPASTVGTDGNWSPNTPPPASLAPQGNWSPNTPPPVGAPTGNWSPNTPPSTMVTDGPNTPPAVVPDTNAQAPQNFPNGNGAARHGGPARTGVITQLWSSSTTPGVWVLVYGIGWKRLAASESGHGALTTLALVARTNGLPVTFHEDGIGQIDELLV